MKSLQKTVGVNAPESRLALFASGVLVGTLVNAFVGMVFRLIGTLILQASWPQGGDTPARYATWPLYFRYCTYALSPPQLIVGAIAGIVVSSVMMLNLESRIRGYVLCGLAFVAVMALDRLFRGQIDSSALLDIPGNLIRGAFLAWVTTLFYDYWEKRR